MGGHLYLMTSTLVMVKMRPGIPRVNCINSWRAFLLRHDMTAKFCKIYHGPSLGLDQVFLSWCYPVDSKCNISVGNIGLVAPFLMPYGNFVFCMSWLLGVRNQQLRS